MRYNKIRRTDISNGPGIRVSIFMQGCTFNCKGCFNPETHDFKGGHEFNDFVIDKIINLASPSHIKGLSILGGEPMHAKNIDGTLKLVHEFKKKYPTKDVWVWSGFNYEDLSKAHDLSEIDVLVDGQYKMELYNPTLKYRGSSNQRVIDIKKTIKNKKIEILEGVTV